MLQAMSHSMCTTSPHMIRHAWDTSSSALTFHVRREFADELPEAGQVCAQLDFRAVQQDVEDRLLAEHMISLIRLKARSLCSAAVNASLEVKSAGNMQRVC